MFDLVYYPNTHFIEYINNRSLIHNQELSHEIVCEINELSALIKRCKWESIQVNKVDIFHIAPCYHLSKSIASRYCQIDNGIHIQFEFQLLENSKVSIWIGAGIHPPQLSSITYPAIQFWKEPNYMI